MEKYEKIREVGEGTFGNVWQAWNKKTGEVVAIKMMKKKYYSLEESRNLREVKSLVKMSHPNIVKLNEVIRQQHILYYVFEYMECNLYQLMKHREKLFSEAEIKNWCRQIFQGLAHVHQRGFFHRDLKPENLLVSKDVIKIADFGLAREIDSQPPYTEYVATRWYRAPEVLLRSSNYNSAVDMWAMGAIIAELFTFSPLFPGINEADEIYRICRVIGSPTENDWPEGLELASGFNYKFPQVCGVGISALMPWAGDNAINLIKSLCSWDPRKRPTAVEALQHPFFQSCFYIPPSLRPKPSLRETLPPSARTEVGLSQLQMEQKTGRRYSGTLPSLKPASDFSFESNEPSNASVQRNLEMNIQAEQRYLRSNLKQIPKYRPAVKNVGVSTCI